MRAYPNATPATDHPAETAASLADAYEQQRARTAASAIAALKIGEPYSGGPDAYLFLWGVVRCLLPEDVRAAGEAFVRGAKL